MKTVEIIMSAQWPEEETRREQLYEGERCVLYWPVPLLPPEMGWLPGAERVEGDPTGEYHQEVVVDFEREGMSLQAYQPRPDGTWPCAELGYPELAYILASADTRPPAKGSPRPDLPIYREHIPTSDLHATRRVAGVLRVSGDGPISRRWAEDDDETPY